MRRPTSPGPGTGGRFGSAAAAIRTSRSPYRSHWVSRELSEAKRRAWRSAERSPRPRRHRRSLDALAMLERRPRRMKVPSADPEGGDRRSPPGRSLAARARSQGRPGRPSSRRPGVDRNVRRPEPRPPSAPRALRIRTKRRSGAPPPLVEPEGGAIVSRREQNRGVRVAGSRRCCGAVGKQGANATIRATATCQPSRAAMSLLDSLSCGAGRSETASPPSTSTVCEVFAQMTALATTPATP